MKKVLLFSTFIVLTAASLARAGSEADTTFKATRGTLFLFGRMFKGSDVTLRVSGRALFADTPGGAISIWELPGPDVPHRPLPDSTIAKFKFDQLAVAAYYRLRSSCTIAQLRESLDVLVSAHRAVADSVVPLDRRQYLIYWRGSKDAEAVEVVGGTAGKVKGSAEPTLWDARRALGIYARQLLIDLDRGCVLFLTRFRANPAQPFGMAFKTEAERSGVLAEVARIRSGQTGKLRYLRGNIGDLIVSDIRREAKAPQ